MTTPGRPGGSPTAPEKAGLTTSTDPVSPTGATAPTRPGAATGQATSPAQPTRSTGAGAPPAAAGATVARPAPRPTPPPMAADAPTQTYPPVPKDVDSPYQGVERRRTFQTSPGATAAAPPVRRARLRLARIDPWSVMKMSFLLSIALGIVVFIAVFVLWSVLDSMRVFESLSTTIADVTGSDESVGFDLMQFVALDRVLGVTTIVMLVNVVLLTALATLAAFIYNLASALIGGLDITWTDPD